MQKTIPIIAMTANAFREDAEKCMEAGMNAHLAKPLDDEKIKQTISEEFEKANIIASTVRTCEGVSRRSIFQ